MSEWRVQEKKYSNSNEVVLSGSKFYFHVHVTETHELATNRCFPPGNIYQDKETLYKDIVSRNAHTGGRTPGWWV